MTSEARVPIAEVVSGRRGLFLIALLLAEFGAAMQGIAYSTVLPVVAQDLDGFALFGATLAAGNIAAVAMLAIAPLVLGRFRPRAVLLTATLLYVIGVGMAVAAPEMVWVLAGAVVRGVAAGLLAGFGLGAIGALYDERTRPRVFGLFSLIWLLPSFVGPALNAVITEWAGWRWALAWPAVLVLAARALMGRYVSAVPWERHRSSARPASGLVVAAFLAIGAWGSTVPDAWGRAVFAGGAVGAAVGIVIFLRSAARRPRRALITFAVLCAGYFGIYEMLSLIVVEGLGESVIWASIAISGGLIAWSVAGLRPRPRSRIDLVVVGTTLIPVSIGVLLGALTMPEPWAVATVIASAVIAGLGMGLAYPLLSSEPFGPHNASGPSHASTIGALVAFAETSGTAWSALLGGGLYSVLQAAGAAPHAALPIALLAIAVPAVAGVGMSIVRVRD
ncbi:MFS transporter [uncultured Microbacterium sp.]|uniref:MFS transporter n=1 Tax=uncultured Microbacterium sp. TaxID=191216 RepID=UPI0035C99A11